MLPLEHIAGRPPADIVNMGRELASHRGLPVYRFSDLNVVEFARAVREDNGDIMEIANRVPRDRYTGHIPLTKREIRALGQAFRRLR